MFLVQMVSDIPVIDNILCSDYYGSIIYDGIMCTDSSDGRGVCSVSTLYWRKEIYLGSFKSLFSSICLNFFAQTTAYLAV